MNITSIYYLIHDCKVIVKVPFKIVRETDKCFFIEQGNRYLKSEIGKPILKSGAQYPYIELVMIDADEATLRKELSKWFTNEAVRIRRTTIQN